MALRHDRARSGWSCSVTARMSSSSVAIRATSSSILRSSCSRTLPSGTGLILRCAAPGRLRAARGHCLPGSYLREHTLGGGPRGARRGRHSQPSDAHPGPAPPRRPGGDGAAGGDRGPPTAGGPNHSSACWWATRPSRAGCVSSPTAPWSRPAPSPRRWTRRSSSGWCSTVPLGSSTSDVPAASPEPCVGPSTSSIVAALTRAATCLQSAARATTSSPGPGAAIPIQTTASSAARTSTAGDGNTAMPTFQLQLSSGHLPTPTSNDERHGSRRGAPGFALAGTPSLPSRCPYSASSSARMA
jgi:hypothetical protein